MKSLAYDKSFKFALSIFGLYRYLCDSKKEYVISKQILRSGTSIGANIKESLYGQSKKDFLAKINSALKEAAETEYWIELLKEINYIDEQMSESLLKECKEIIKILAATVKTTKLHLENERK